MVQFTIKTKKVDETHSTIEALMSFDLTSKQQLFCEYLVASESQNHGEAYRQAYPGSSKKAADSNANRMMKNDKILSYIDHLKSERSKRLAIDADWLLKRLVAEVEADIADIYDDENKLLPITQWPKIWRQGLVSGVDVDRSTVKMADRSKRLEMIGKHVSVKAFDAEKKVEITPAELVIDGGDAIEISRQYANLMGPKAK